MNSVISLSYGAYGNTVTFIMTKTFWSNDVFLPPLGTSGFRTCKEIYDNHK